MKFNYMVAWNFDTSPARRELVKTRRLPDGEDVFATIKELKAHHIRYARQELNNLMDNIEGQLQTIKQIKGLKLK